MIFAPLLALKSIDLEGKSMTLVATKRQLNQEAFDLDKGKIEIAHEYEYLGIDFYSLG
jgi:hypothetical protein